MSWKEIGNVVRRLGFVKLALQAQRSMSQLCREFGISRKTGYQWKERFEREGRRGLRPRSRRPHRSPEELARVWVERIRRLRRRHRSWGSRKLAARLRVVYGVRGAPAARTVGDWLRRLGLNQKKRRRARRGPELSPPALTQARRSNQVWTVDFKGWFRTGDGERVEPLTVRDLFSRYLLTISLLRHQTCGPTQRVFRRLFARHGYPRVIRVDNGNPFGTTGPAGLSQLSAWWTALGVRVEFIAPGHPEQNGAHEQMHRVLKAETTRPASTNLRAQQRRTNRWVKIYNQIRPHEGLQQRAPGTVYRRKRQRLHRDGAVSYGRGWKVRRVRSNGEIKWQGRKRFVGEALVGYPVGLRERSAGQWEVQFAGQLLGELWESDAGGIRPARYMRPSRK